MSDAPASGTDRRRVAVVGGGLAGITAALDAADTGHDVVLLERRPRLGGLTHSFSRDVALDGSGASGAAPAVPLAVDNGQHVFLRCCTAYRAFLERLGTAGLVDLQERLDIPVRELGSPRAARLRRTALPAPLHLARALLGYPLLSPAERLQVVRGALAIRRVDRADPRTDERSFGDWLRAHGQGERATAALWDLVGVATLNAPADEASLSLAATVMQEGLLTDAGAGDIGWSRVPLSQLHGDAALTALRAAGVDVRLRTAVEGLSSAPPTGAGDAPWTLHLRDGGSVGAGGVVLAVPPAATEALAPEGSLDLPAGWSRRLGASPIVDVHVVLDRTVLRDPFVAGVGTLAQWVFDRTGSSGLRGVGDARDLQYLAVSISAATGLVDAPAADVLGRVLPELTALLPGMADAEVLAAFVTREREATFSPAPGSGALRPAARTRAPGLAVAGAWTATGWPATMEGAVRSGHAAAEVVLRAPAPGRTEAGLAA